MFQITCALLYGQVECSCALRFNESENCIYKIQNVKLEQEENTQPLPLTNGEEEAAADVANVANVIDVANAGQRFVPDAEILL